MFIEACGRPVDTYQISAIISLSVSCEALVLLKAGHFEDAAAAAEEALQLNGHNSKAAFRQAQAGNRG
jgi:hypothetical protein